MNALLRNLILGGALLLASWWTVFLRGRLGDHERDLRTRDDRIQTLSDEIEVRDASLREAEEALRAKDGELEEMGQELAKKERQIHTLEAARRLLKVDHRVAKLEVLSQGASGGNPDAVRTRLRFVELGPDGEQVGKGVETTVEGRIVYVETLVIKFGDDYVERGDALRGTSLCLFRRLFGERQRPDEGVPIDTAGTQPLVYASDDVPEAFHRDLWERFWDYANDPPLAHSMGVRAIHGEAPFIEVRPGKTYSVELRASGGLTIRTD